MSMLSVPSGGGQVIHLLVAAASRVARLFGR